MISVDQLVGICRQHAKTPLGLIDYRTLFETGGAVDTHFIDERSEDVTRTTLLTIAIATLFANDLRPSVGCRHAILYLVLADDPASDGTNEAELQGLLDTLASPLIGVLDGSDALGYLLTMAPEVAHLRLEVVAGQLGNVES